MTARRITRTRTLPPLAQKFAIDFRLEVAGQGITVAEAEAYMREVVRYGAAAYMFKVSHPTGEDDLHGRPENARFGGNVGVIASIVE